MTVTNTNHQKIESSITCKFLLRLCKIISCQKKQKLLMSFLSQKLAFIHVTLMLSGVSMSSLSKYKQLLANAQSMPSLEKS